MRGKFQMPTPRRARFSLRRLFSAPLAAQAPSLLDALRSDPDSITRGNYLLGGPLQPENYKDPPTSVSTAKVR